MKKKINIRMFLQCIVIYLIIGSFSFNIYTIMDFLAKKVGVEYYIDTSYELNMGKWDEACWAKALDKLGELRDKKNIIGVNCFGSTLGDGHAWIEYNIKENGKTYRIAYDPTFDKEVFKEEID